MTSFNQVKVKPEIPDTQGIVTIDNDIESGKHYLKSEPAKNVKKNRTDCTITDICFAIIFVIILIILISIITSKVLCNEYSICNFYY